MPHSQDILINWTPQETRVAIIESGAVQELHVERTLERGLVGNVYTGKVVRVLPGMQSAFIDIGLERAAFLHVADLHREDGAARVHPRSAEVQVPIEKRVHEGQTLMVQVIKDPIGSKGARLSTQISVAGRLLVFLPQDDHLGISQKIGSPELRDQLRERMLRLLGEADSREGRTRSGGFILRTNAEDASDDELAVDIAYLRKTWATIREHGMKAPPGTLLYQELNLAQRVLRDLVNEQVQSIRIDSLIQFDALKCFGEEFTPDKFSTQGHSHFDFSAQHTRRSVERSLRRLRTDYLDLVLIHSDGNDLDILQHTDVLHTLQQLKQEGWIRAVGISSKTLEGGLLAAEVCDAVMVTYNAGQQDEAPVIAKSAQHGAAVLLKKVLASGHICHDAPAPDANLSAQRETQDPIQRALDFAYAPPGVTSAIIGTLNEQHLRDNLFKAIRAQDSVARVNE